MNKDETSFEEKVEDLFDKFVNDDEDEDTEEEETEDGEPDDADGDGDEREDDDSEDEEDSDADGEDGGRDSDDTADSDGSGAASAGGDTDSEDEGQNAEPEEQTSTVKPKNGGISPEDAEKLAKRLGFETVEEMLAGKVKEPEKKPESGKEQEPEKKPEAEKKPEPEKNEAEKAAAAFASMQKADLDAIRKIPALSGVKNLRDLKHMKEFCDLREAGKTAEEAIRIAERETIDAYTEKVGERKAAGKKHLRSLPTSSGGGNAEISKKEIREARSWLSDSDGMSDKEIAELLRRVKTNEED